MQLASAAMTFTETNPTGWWPRIDAPAAHAALLDVYNVGGVAISFSDTAAAVGTRGAELWTFFTLEDLLLACVPASFILSYALRRVSIEELSGRC